MSSPSLLLPQNILVSLDDLYITGIPNTSINVNNILSIADYCLHQHTKYPHVLYLLLRDQQLMNIFKSNVNVQKTLFDCLLKEIHNFMSNPTNTENLSAFLNIAWMSSTTKAGGLYKVVDSSNTNIFSNFLDFLLKRNNSGDANIITSTMMNIYCVHVIHSITKTDFFQETLQNFGVLEKYADMGDIVFYSYQCGLAFILFTMISSHEDERSMIQQKYLSFFSYVIKRISTFNSTVAFHLLIDPIRIDQSSLSLFEKVLTVLISFNHISKCQLIFEEFCRSLMQFQGRQSMFPSTLVEKLIHPSLHNFISSPQYSELIIKLLNDPLQSTMVMSNKQLQEQLFEQLTTIEPKDVTEHVLKLSTYFLRSNLDNGIASFLTLMKNANSTGDELVFTCFEILNTQLLSQENKIILVSDAFYSNLLLLFTSTATPEFIQLFFKTLQIVWVVKENKKSFNPYISQFTKLLLEHKKCHQLILCELMKSITTSTFDTNFNIDTPSIINFPKILPVIISVFSHKACPIDLFISIQKLFSSFNINLYYLSKYCSIQMIDLVLSTSDVIISEQLMQLIESALFYSCDPLTTKHIINKLQTTKQKNLLIKLLFKLLSPQSKRPFTSLNLKGTPISYSKPISFNFKSTTIMFMFQFSTNQQNKQTIFHSSSAEQSLSISVTENKFILLFNENTANEREILYDFVFHPNMWYFVCLNFDQKANSPVLQLTIHSNSSTPVLDQQTTFKNKVTSFTSHQCYIGGVPRTNNLFYGEFSMFSIHNVSLSPIDVLEFYTQLQDGFTIPSPSKCVLLVSALNSIKGKKPQLFFQKYGKEIQFLDIDDVIVTVRYTIQLSLHYSNFFPIFFYFVRQLPPSQFCEVFKENTRAFNPLYFLLSFIGRCVTNSPELKSDFSVINGASILQSIIAQCSLKYVVPVIFDQLQKIADYFENESTTYDSFRSVIFDYRLWTPYSFSLQKYVLQKYVVSMQDKPKYLQFLSDILLLYFLPTFPSNMLLHGSLSRSLNTNELTELRLFIWNALMCSITPVKSCMQVIVSTLEAISDETIFNEGVNMFLSSVEFTTKWNDLFSNYLCEELLCLMYHVGFKGKELLLQMLCNFLENVDQKFSKFHEVCNSIILAISHEQLFTQTEFNILKNINVKTAELLQTQLIFYSLFQYATTDVADALMTFWFSQRKSLLPISTGKKINFTVVEGLVDGAQKDSKRLPAVASLLRTGIGNEVLCKAVNIAWLFLTYFKADEQCGENELTTDLLLCTCKALDEKKNEKAIDVFIHCINIFLSRILQSPNQNNVVLDSFQPFLEKYKKNSAAMMAINKLEIVSILQQAETSNKPPSLGIMDKQSVAMYCMYCMDRIRFIEDNNKRKKLLHFLSSIAFNFHEDIFHEINKVTSIDQTKKDLFIDLIIKDNELVNYSTVVDSDVFPMIRRMFRSIANELMDKEEDLRALAFDEINAASKKKKDKKSKQMSSGVAGGELRLNEEMSRIDNLRLKLNKEAERYQRKWKKFDGYIGYVVEGIPTHWYIDSKEIHGKKILLKGNCLFDIHKDATSSSSLRKQETLITESEFFMKRKSINNNVFLQHYDTTIDDLPQQVQQTVFETTCELVTLKAFLKIKDFRNPWTLSGCFKLYENIIMFTETTENSSSIIQTFHTQTVFDVFPRRYLMKHTGIEIFFKDGTSLYILFQSKKTMSKALQLVRKASGLPDFNLENSLQRHTKRWQNGEITNFDYLMILNRYSSRSYHDLTQYPVFPWILQDYTKDRIDLTDPKSFRDLGKPIPCINPERFKIDEKKFNDLFGKDGIMCDQIPYYYSTHYSACDYVFFFLIRCEPFTTMFLNMNSGHYDKPERMFYSIEHTWKTCMNSAQCNIELIPEFFYLPDFLSNDNGFSFGCLPDSNTPISSVELPPWAEDQHDFIEIHRAALESPYVSMNLHKWIDLIFGYQSTGTPALNAKNLYYPTSYIENYDPSTLTQEESDLFLQRLMLSGQCPIQLFTKPHPTRQFYSTTLFSFSTDKNLLPVVLDCTRYGNETIALSEGNTHRIITDGSNKAKITTTQLCMPSHITCRKGLSVISSDGKYSIIASQEDNNLHFFHNETGKEVMCIRLHRKKICMLSMARTTTTDYLISASEDTLVLVSKLTTKNFLKLGRASVISSHIGNPNVCCFDPRTRFLITICDQNKVVCTRLDTMKTHWSFICEDRVKSVCIYNSSLYFVHDNNVCVYSLTAKLLKKHDYIANFILPMFNMQYICCIGNKKIIFCSHLSMKQISSDSGTLRNDEVVFALSLSKEIWLFTKQGNLHRYLQLPPTSLQ